MKNIVRLCIFDTVTRNGKFINKYSMPERHSGVLDVSVDNVIFGFDENILKVLVIERKPFPDEKKGMSAIPGDLVYPKESLDEAAARV